jgi:hypothetical protein
MARVAAFEYETLPPALQQLADAYQARGASWDHLRVLATGPRCTRRITSFCILYTPQGWSSPRSRNWSASRLPT